MKNKTLFVETAWRLLLMLFLYTALDKLFNFADFTIKINNQPFDNRYTTLLSFGIPLVELLICGFLLLHGTRRLGLILSAGLMLVFTIYVALVTFHFYGRLPCSCSAIHEKFTWPQHLAINVVFLLMAILGACFFKSSSAKETGHQTSVHHSTA
ncbi:MauE/DoxX family redox-associated membrane protein [Chitinophaga defluvii]|uniref:MauE/DoxX family redox-associated membrane protein n=1 Tax=Chitinophaga defluvii TaxID=3163343 RepID=A0ABV2TCC4_9BACT